MENIFDHMSTWPLYILPIIGLIFIFQGLNLFKFLLAMACSLSLGFMGWFGTLHFDPPAQWIPWTIAIILGLIGIWLATVLHKAATFLMGCASIWLLFPFIQSIIPHDPDWLPYAATAILGIFLGMIALLLKDKIIVILTSLYGAGLFTHSFFLILSKHDILKPSLLSSEDKTFHFIWLGLFAILATAGLMSQKKKK